MTQLPLFEGRNVQAAQLKLSGNGNADRAHRIDEELYLIARVTVAGVGHDYQKGLLVRVEKLDVASVRELPAAMDPEILFARAKRLADDANGQGSLPIDLDDEG